MTLKIPDSAPSYALPTPSAGEKGESRSLMTAGAPPVAPPEDGVLVGDAVLAATGTPAPPADESRPPLGLEMFEYTSGDPATWPLMETPADKPHLRGGVGTPPVAGMLHQANAANLLSPEWQAVVADHVTRNGGLGNAEDGYLAFSAEFGFVRLFHEGLTPEQNRRIAAMSLQTGWAIEKLPGRHHDTNVYEKPKDGEWVDGFIQQFDEKFERFLADPTEALEVKDGSRNRYVMKYDEESGRVFSQHYRRKSRFGRLASKALKLGGPIIDGLSMLGMATGQVYLTAGLQAAKQGLISGATGKFTASQGLQLIASLTPAAAGTKLGAVLRNPVVQGGLALGADYADDGRIQGSTFANVLAPSLVGITTTNPAFAMALERAAVVAAKKIDGQDPGIMDFYSVLQPALFGVERGANDTATKARLDGALRGDATRPESWNGLLANVFDEPEDLAMMSEVASTLVRAVDEGKVGGSEVLDLLKVFFGDEIEAFKKGARERLGL